MMMALGLFVFSIPTATYQQLARQSAWRHAANQRVGARAAYQFVGPGQETINLNGWIAPGQMGDSQALDMLRNMGNTGKAWTLVDGLGVMHGVYVITNMSQTGSVFNAAGQARKLEFSLTLERIDEDKADAWLGDLTLPEASAAAPVQDTVSAVQEPASQEPQTMWT